MEQEKTILIDKIEKLEEKIKILTKKIDNLENTTKNTYDIDLEKCSCWNIYSEE